MYNFFVCWKLPAGLALFPSCLKKRILRYLVPHYLCTLHQPLSIQRIFKESCSSYPLGEPRASVGEQWVPPQLAERTAEVEGAALQALEPLLQHAVAEGVVPCQGESVAFESIVWQAVPSPLKGMPQGP